MESIQRYLEDMVPELEDLRKRRLFTNAQIKEIVRRRTKFEYEVCSFKPKVEDFLRAISYEQALDKLRVLRKEKLNDEENFRPSDSGCRKRSHVLYQRLLRRFPADLKLWLRYIAYSKRVGSGRAVSRSFGRALQIHSGAMHLWIRAAAWEYEGNGNIDSARTLLQRALKIEKNHAPLWCAFFKMELLYVEKLRRRRKVLKMDTDGISNVGTNPDADDSLRKKFVDSLPMVQAILKGAMRARPNDAQFTLKLMELVPTHSHYAKLREGIYVLLASMSDPQAVLLLAGRRVRKKQSDYGGVLSLKVEKSGLKTFEAAVEKHGTDKLWEAYSNYCLGRAIAHADDECCRVREFLLRRAVDVLQRAQDLGFTSQALLTDGVQLLLRVGDTESAVKLARKLVEMFPSLPGPWLVYAKLNQRRHALDSKLGAETATRVLSDALKKVGNDKLGVIWEEMLDVAVAQHWVADDGSENPARLTPVHSLFKRALMSAHHYTGHSNIKQMYLEWAVAADGDSLDTVVDYILVTAPSQMTPDLFIRVIRLTQTMASKPNAKHRTRLRYLFDKALKQYGKTSTELWLLWMHMERQLGDLASVSGVYKQAAKTLTDDRQFLDACPKI